MLPEGPNDPSALEGAANRLTGFRIPSSLLGRVDQGKHAEPNRHIQPNQREEQAQL